MNYVTRFNELMLSLAEMDPHTQREMFILGLKPSVAEAVRMQKPADLRAAQELAVTADTIQFQSRIKQQPYQYHPHKAAGSSSGPTPMELGTHQGESNGEINAIQCWHCKEEGHMSWECPKKKHNGGRGNFRGRGNYRGGRSRGRGRGRNTQHGAPN